MESEIKFLREICSQCGKPVFPVKRVSPDSMTIRPGFCACFADRDRSDIKSASKPNERKQRAEQGSLNAFSNLGDADNLAEEDDLGEAAAGREGASPSADAPDDKDQGHIIKLANQPQQAKPVRRFDPNVELKDIADLGYSFQERIGKGTLSYVYQAKSKNIENVLAIKIFHRKPFENKRTLKRLEQEARRAQELDHAHLASVYDFGLSSKGYPFLVMDFLAGPSLAEVIKNEGFLDVPRVVDIFIQVAEALDYAHKENMLHRDLKPSNIYLLKSTDKRDFVKISDLGIAKVLPNPGRETKYMTPEGEEFGNPSYMSPEQCLGEKLSPSSDLYSLGCVMYEALSGKLPLSSSNPVRLAFKQVSEEPKSLTQRFQDLDIPEDLNLVVMKLLNKKPEDRFAKAGEVREALLTIKQGKPIKLSKAKASSSEKNAGQSGGKNSKGFLQGIIDKVKGKTDK
jgi:serine/threonine-protein kinase